MSDNICPMRFYSSGRLFDSFESVAQQAGDLLGKLKELAEKVNDLLSKELAEKVNELLANSRPACYELAG
jgi:hypothetical protein